MNRSQLEHIIRAASQISGDSEIVVIGSQAIHAQNTRLPPIVFQSMEADVYPRNHPERADEIDGAIGELSNFHETFGYYAQGVSPQTAILPAGWERRLRPLTSPNTEGATGLCLDIHDLVLSKYAAGREKDLQFNQELIRHGLVTRRTLTRLLRSMPVDDQMKAIIAARIKADYAAVTPPRAPRAPRR
jgi:hypothetical protein